MPVCSEVKRTLVKSPPELWSELSDPESLTRHLDCVGDVRITRAEPETEVEWEAEGASGSVRLEPSGFGTKVTLSLSREVAEPVAPAAPEPVPDAEGAEPIAETEPAVEPEAAVEPEPIAEPEAAIELDPVAQAEPAAEPETGLEPVAPRPSTEPRRGFFARLFKRRRKEPAVSEWPVEPMTEPAIPEPAIPEPAIQLELEEPEAAISAPEQARAQPGPQVESAAEPEPEPQALGEPDLEATLSSEDEPEAVRAEATEARASTVAADLTTIEAQMAEQDEAMLTAMLDRLGAAHHRPFSRS